MNFIAKFNALEQAVQPISGRWRIVIISVLSSGPRRFNELQRAAVGISSRMLALDLDILEKAKVIKRNISVDQSIKVEYELTARGVGLKPIIDQLYEWHIAEMTEASLVKQ